MSGYGDGGYGGDAGSNNFLLFSRNLLETGVVTVTSEATPVTRLYDRSRFPAWQATTNATQDIDIDVASATYSHVAFVGVTTTTGLEIYRGSSFPPATLTLSIASLADPYIANLGASYSDRYVRIRILSGGVVPALGEVFLGLPQTLTLPPFIRNAGRGTLANVRRDLSPAGVTWAVKLGTKRSRLAYAWTGMDQADLTAVEAAYDDIDQGAKPLFVQDELGVAYWVNCVTDALAPVPIGNGLYELPELTFEEAL